jgi:hypothetical protein
MLVAMAIVAFWDSKFPTGPFEIGTCYFRMQQSPSPSDPFEIAIFNYFEGFIFSLVFRLWDLLHTCHKT